MIGIHSLVHQLTFELLLQFELLLHYLLFAHQTGLLEFCFCNISLLGMLFLYPLLAGLFKLCKGGGFIRHDAWHDAWHLSLILALFFVNPLSHFIDNIQFVLFYDCRNQITHRSL